MELRISPITLGFVVFLAEASILPLLVGVDKSPLYFPFRSPLFLPVPSLSLPSQFSLNFSLSLPPSHLLVGSFAP